jgi:mRNA-degrading endonuclease toxin of MazEF toxin-antitoxin module
VSEERGAVVKGPDLFADNDFRPYVRINDDTHPFTDEEAVYVAATTTRRSAAIPLTGEDFTEGGLPRETYVNPWTVVTIRHADIHGEEGRLTEETTETIARATAGYLGVP